MGFLSGLLSAAAPIAGTIFGGPAGGAIGGALGGLLSSHDAPSSATTTQQQQLDPRISSMLFGANGSQGLLSQYQSMLNTPQSDAAKAYGSASGDYLKQYAGGDLGAIHNAATGLMGGQAAPQISSAPQMAATPSYGANVTGPAAANIGSYAVGNMVQAPSQNKLDLSGSFNSLINGAPGANPYLTGAIQKGIDQSSNAFGNLVTDSKNATQDVLGGIRGNAVLAGQYGGSRQGIAEGKAIDSMNTNLSRAASQFGQNNTDAAVAAQAGAYDADRNRQLSATQGLSGQQYGVAQQDAATKNAAEFMNVQAGNDNAKFNAGLQQQSNLANQSAVNQAQLANQGVAQQTGLANLGTTMQTSLANQSAHLQTNQMNNAGAATGSGLLGGLLGQASGAVNAQDNYGLTRAQGVNGLLAPYLSANQGVTRTDPLYQNTGGNILGGALAGSQLGGLFGGSNPFSSTRNQDNYGVNTGAGTSSLANMRSPSPYFGA